MKRERCILHANCQGEPLLTRLNLCPAFAERYETRLYTNYVHEPVPDAELAGCSLLLYQYLEPRWGDLASETLLTKLPDGARSLCIPNMFFKGYWPFWSGEPGFDYRCTLLDDLLAKGLPPEETVLLFLHRDPGADRDLLAMVADSLHREREREAHTPVKYVDILTAEYRDTRLFNTVNHPGPRLLNHAAAEVLRALGFEPPDPAVFAALGDPFPEFEHPINPHVADHFGWNFARPDTQYNIYGRKMDFARYAANYVMARNAGINDFIGFLQGAYIAL